MLLPRNLTFMRKVTVSYERQIEIHEYAVVNGRRARIHYNRGYVYPSREGESGTTGLHRIIMELLLGRRLKRGEHVHHKDGNRMNNSPDNLEVVDGAAHNRAHIIQRNLKHDPDNFVCSRCTSSKRPHKALGLCENCWGSHRRLAKVTHPCVICGWEIGKRGYCGLCARCATASWSHCRACGRSRKELPQSRHSPINVRGLCHACYERFRRHCRQVPALRMPL
ncbi:MAG: HNH endonuclease [Pyrinomonadaceae bacterium]